MKKINFTEKCLLGHRDSEYGTKDNPSEQEITECLKFLNSLSKRQQDLIEIYGESQFYYGMARGE